MTSKYVTLLSCHSNRYASFAKPHSLSSFNPSRRISNVHSGLNQNSQVAKLLNFVIQPLKGLIEVAISRKEIGETY